MIIALGAYRLSPQELRLCAPQLLTAWRSIHAADLRNKRSTEAALAKAQIEEIEAALAEADAQ